MKKKLCVISGVLSSLMVLAVLSLNHPSATIRLAYATGENNDIQFIEIYHYNSTAWVMVGNCTSSSGTSYRVHDTWAVRFNVTVKFNSTLASSTAEAISYTRIYMNITYSGGTIWTNAELNNTSCSLVGSFYIVKDYGLWNQTGYPVAGVEYECKIDYDGYY